MNTLSEVLNDPESMQKISQLAGSLGLGEGSPLEKPPPAQDTADIGKLMQIGSLLASSGAEDKNIALLNSMRPLLSEENRRKVDRLVKIFRLMAAYPLLRDSGILGGDLFGTGK